MDNKLVKQFEEKHDCSYDYDPEKGYNEFYFYDKDIIYFFDKNPSQIYMYNLDEGAISLDPTVLQDLIRLIGEEQND